MHSDFKFLSGGNPYFVEYLPENMACWYYWDYRRRDFGVLSVLEGEFFGIGNFLSRFQSGQRVPIIQITGPDGFVFDHDNMSRPGGGGWGFNIQKARLIIRWLEHIPD